MGNSLLKNPLYKNRFFLSCHDLFTSGESANGTTVPHPLRQPSSAASVIRREPCGCLGGTGFGEPLQRLNVGEKKNVTYTKIID